MSLGFFGVVGAVPACRKVAVPQSLQGNAPCATGHYVCAPELGTARGELLLYFPGTGGKPTDDDGMVFYAHAQALGFHVASVCYDSGGTTIASQCGRSSSPSCFSDVRRQKMYSVDDGGIPRALALVEQLAGNSVTSGEGWGAFLMSGATQDIDYAKVVAAGHSQGAGMAALLAKDRLLLGVVMLAGVDDVVNTGPASAAAPWISAPSATPEERIFGLGNTRGFACGMWSVDWPAMSLSGWYACDDDGGGVARVPPTPASHMLCSTMELPDCSNGMDYHFAVLRSDAYAPAWRFMLSRGNTSAGEHQQPIGTSSPCTCIGRQPAVV